MPEQAQRRQIMSQLAVMAKDPNTGVDKPWFVVRYMVQAMLVQFKQLNGRPATIMRIPPMIEAALQVDFARSLDVHGRLRELYADEFMGCTPVWDAPEFQVE